MASPDDARGASRTDENSERDAHCIRLLVANGYVVQTVRRRMASTEIECLRLDEFGAGVNYLIALARDPVGDGDLNTLSAAARQRNAQLVVVTSQPLESAISISIESLVARLGGPIESILPLSNDYAEQLITLGHHRSVDGVEGDPATAFEGHVHAGLRFLLGTRVLRYGQDRRFEAVPDGFGPLPNAPTFLYDAKSAADGYHVDRDTIRQFADYVDVYRKRYESWLGEPFVFVVVSSQFADNAAARQERSRELYGDCRVPLAFLRSQELADSTALVSDAPWVRSSVDWKHVFAPVDITASRLAREIASVNHDRVLA